MLNDSILVCLLFFHFSLVYIKGDCIIRLLIVVSSYVNAGRVMMIMIDRRSRVEGLYVLFFYLHNLGACFFLNNQLFGGTTTMSNFQSLMK